MSAQEFSGKITAVELKDPWVLIELDSAPGKRYAWSIASFIHKPKPQVGLFIRGTAHPGRVYDYDVTSITTIADALPAEVVGNRPEETRAPVQATVEAPAIVKASEYKPTAPASTIEQLAERILLLKAAWKERFAKDMLEFKWAVGKEIWQTRLSEETSFRELEKRTGINREDLRCCARFFEKFPSRGYALVSWRRIVAELPGARSEAVERPALVLDSKHTWTCPTCGQQFEHLHLSNGKHRLREVDEE
jgi:hypothetical protein